MIERRSYPGGICVESRSSGQVQQRWDIALRKPLPAMAISDRGVKGPPDAVRRPSALARVVGLSWWLARLVQAWYPGHGDRRRRRDRAPVESLDTLAQRPEPGFRPVDYIRAVSGIERRRSTSTGSSRGFARTDPWWSHRSRFVGTEPSGSKTQLDCFAPSIPSRLRFGRAGPNARTNWYESSEQLGDHLAGDIGQPFVSAVVKVGELR